MPATPAVRALVPQLPSTNLERTSQFYRQKLGCRETGRYPDLLMLHWQGHEIHFWLTEDEALAKSSSCYLRVDNIQEFYAAYQAVPGLLHPRGALAKRPWGMNEFYVLDPDGNLLKFGEKAADWDVLKYPE